MNTDTKRFLEFARSEKARFLAKFPELQEVQQKLFSEYVLANADTAFGQEHGFSSFQSIDDYRKAVPITDYDGISPWIERQAAGEERVLTLDSPIAYRRTSGTTGPSKKIPTTQKALDLDHAYLAMAFARLGEMFPETLREDAAATFVWNPNLPEPDRTESGHPWLAYSYQVAPQREGDPLYGAPGTLAPWYWGPRELPATDYAYHRLRMAMEADLRALISVNPATLVVLAHQMQEWAPKLIRDIREGALLGRAHTRPNPGRADELQALVDNGGLAPAEVWPRLCAIQCWKAANSGFYIPQLKEKFGQQVEVISFCYMGSEGMYGLPIDDHPTAGVPVFDRTLFEFVPADEELRPDSQTLLLHEVEVGAEYHLVHTGCNGLYRHSVGDYVKIVDIEDGVPRMHFSGRRGQVSSFTGEKITVPHVLKTVQEAQESTGTVIEHFTCCPQWGDPPGYVFMVELSPKSTEISEQVMAEALERALREANEEYPAKRDTHRLVPIKAHLVRSGTFARQRELAIAEGSAVAAQYKDKALQKDDKLVGVLRALSKKETNR